MSTYQTSRLGNVNGVVRPQGAGSEPDMRKDNPCNMGHVVDFGRRILKVQTRSTLIRRIKRPNKWGYAFDFMIFFIDKVETNVLPIPLFLIPFNSDSWPLLWNRYRNLNRRIGIGSTLIGSSSGIFTRRGDLVKIP